MQLWSEARKKVAAGPSLFVVAVVIVVGCGSGLWSGLPDWVCLRTPEGDENRHRKGHGTSTERATSAKD
jgi:hypothetical protein